MSDMISRRKALSTIGAAGVAVFTPKLSRAQTAQKAEPPSVISNPPRDFTRPVTYPDPDIITLDPSFNSLRVGNTPIQRLWTGGMWCEGPAWNGQGQYLIWSDIPNNRQMRWIEDDGRVTVFRQPSGNSNGNTFDHQGRQLSCEHSGRRVVRYEHDGSITVIADTFQGKRLNSPNDIACRTAGSSTRACPMSRGGQAISRDV
jgi:gluconolactonase